MPTFERIIQAALNSLPSDEQMNEWTNRPDYRKDTPQPTNALTGWDGRTLDIDSVNFASEYAEPGYSDPSKAILFADWNACSRRVQDILERAGFELEWEDEWSTCQDCGKAVRTSADSYGWQPSYVIMNECELICLDCVKANCADEYLESLENNPRTALNTTDIDPSQYGYTLLPETYENGFHPGMNDDPKKIFNLLKDSHNRILFQIHEQSQFYISFRVWTKIDWNASIQDAIDFMRDIARSDECETVEQYQSAKRVIQYLEQQIV